MNQTAPTSRAPELNQAISELQIAMPVPRTGMDQDQEWLVYKSPEGWREIRLHDYGDVYSVPGLYEKWVYEVFQCRSPQKVAELLVPTMQAAGQHPGDLSVLDLGAGNGFVAEVLREHGITSFVGVDIFPEAAEAAERDRPGLYRDFVIGDLTALHAPERERLDSHRFNCLTCVAALGFGDIPPVVFGEAFNHIEDDGWIAFTIKRDFVDTADRSGFANLILNMMEQGVMEPSAREPFVHRVSTSREELVYEAFIGRKRASLPADWISELKD